MAAQPDEVLADFRVSGPGSRQLWKTVPAAAVKHLWEQYMKLGFVRDEDALEQVANQFKENVAKLYGNTVLAGHSSGGEEYMDEVEKIEKKTSIQITMIRTLPELLRYGKKYLFFDFFIFELTTEFH